MYIITGTPFFISFYEIYFKMKKLLCIFHAVWNISVAVIGIHFAISKCKAIIQILFVKKTNMPNSVKSLGYIKYYSSDLKTC